MRLEQTKRIPGDARKEPPVTQDSCLSLHFNSPTCSQAANKIILVLSLTFPPFAVFRVIRGYSCSFLGYGFAALRGFHALCVSVTHLHV